MLKASLCALIIVTASSSFAHDLMILPAKSIVTKAPDKIAVDVTATHGVYRLDKPVTPNNISVYGPDGEKIRNIGTIIKSATRTSFDLAVDSDGTYKILYSYPESSYTTTYTIGARNTKKRERLSKSQLEGVIPKDAKNIETVKSTRYAMSFVTAKTPTFEPLEPTNTDFEIIPVTHPADYVNGEEIAFKALVDGKVVPGVSVEIRAEAGLYNSDLETISLSTDKEGVASLIMENAGRYAAVFSYESGSQDPEADKEKYVVFYTFEVVNE
ncbi:DUF4198 domain-containing protein [Marinomonas sp. 2405UD66-6]|uniref:DUF4198 domain-containing protein n=1 Tax=Marinomonas sp. 2405UD66-6 TaxID=3391834 RepID=UPI0039C9043D